MSKWLSLGTCVVIVAVSCVSADASKGGRRAAAPQPVQLTALSTLPVREVTVFKDGHAFLLHEGRMSTDSEGCAHIDRLPTPVVGTFWAYSADPAVQLKSVVASRRRVRIDQTALNIQELLRANIGAEAFITESDTTYHATILGVPTRSSEELARTSPAEAPEALPQRGDVILLQIDTGVKAIPISRIRDVIFKKPPTESLVREEFRNLLTLNLARTDGGSTGPARVGVTYLQKGLRWIPSYKVLLDGDGSATVKLQATLLNELTDLEDVTVHLVIGVPTFKFKDTIDPIALQQTLAQLSQHFQDREDSFSNVMMSQAPMQQVQRYGGDLSGPLPQLPVDLGPQLAGSERAEDLYVFTVEHIRLKKGQRMIMPIAECTLDYKDVFTLDFPLTPPAQVRQNFSGEQQAQMARLLASPKVVHKIRLTNDGEHPLTTAPALVMRDGRILAQSMMTYTAVGAESDLEITPAVDIRVTKADRETGRKPDAVTWNGRQYGRIDLAGKISLTSYRGEPVELEVTRHVAGNIDSADADGRTEMLNALECFQRTWGAGRSYMGSWHDWPRWWLHFNGFGRIKWQVQLEPGKTVDLGYIWHYYWGS